MRVLLIAMLCAASLTGANFPMSWRFVPRKPVVMAGVEWRRLLATPTGVLIRQQLDRAGPGGPELALLSGLDHVVFSGEESAPGAARGLAVLTGRFRLDTLRQMAAAENGSRFYLRGVEVLAPPQARSGDPLVALVDAQTLVIAERAVLAETLERGSQRAWEPLPRSLWHRARSLAQENEIWLAALVPPHVLAPQAMPHVPFLTDIVGIELAAGFGHHAKVRLNLDTGSLESAERLAHGLVGLMQLAIASHPQFGPMLAPLLSKLHVEYDDRAVRLALEVDPAEIETMQTALRANQPAPVPGVRATVRSNVPMTGDTKPQVIPAEPPRKRVIRIEGLDEGPKETPFPNP